MIESPRYRRVAVAALVAFAALAGVAAAAPDGTVVSPDERALSSVSADQDDFNATIGHDGDRLVVRAAENQTIRIRTDAEPGTEITVVAKSSSQFLKTQTVAVSDDGTATATFDFYDVAAGTEFVASVQKAEGSSVDGLLVNDTATIDAEEPLTVASGSNLTVRGETSAEPGTELVVGAKSSDGTSFLKTARATVSEDGTFAATFNFADVEPGTEFEVAVRENATLTPGPIEGVVRETTTDESESAFTTAGETETTSTTTTVRGTDGHADEFGVPGFGVPVALLALLAAIALATRT
ncbi:hypothetical protein BRC82_02565 [Halobacteriales archaeon QS_1_67_19]|nr:MAG: hypothetical protein BRC82_02565 [Halobacteriales archaeon QS_1_67_19]